MFVLSFVLGAWGGLVVEALAPAPATLILGKHPRFWFRHAAGGVWLGFPACEALDTAGASAADPFAAKTQCFARSARRSS